MTVKNEGNSGSEAEYDNIEDDVLFFSVTLVLRVLPLTVTPDKRSAIRSPILNDSDSFNIGYPNQVRV